MADDLRINIRVDYKQVDKSTASLTKLASASKLVESNVTKMTGLLNKGFNQDLLLGVFSQLEAEGMSFSMVLKSLDQDQKMAAAAAEYHNNKLLGLSTTAKSARSSAEVFTQALKAQEAAEAAAAREAEAYSQRLEKLRQKYNPLYATSRLYETMLDEINEAHSAGVLNIQQFEAAQERLNQEFTQGTGAFQRYQTQFKQGFNQMGVISQQVGYQVGDFLVQVQSGTNPMVAFGQQATQLLGVLYLLPSPIMASRVALLGLSVSVTTLIASVSIILPLLTAVGAYLIRSKQRAEEAAQGTTTFAKSLEDAKKKSADLRKELQLLAAGYKDTAEAAFAGAVEQAQAEVIKAQARLDRARGIAKKGARGNLKAAQEELRLAQEQLDNYLQRRDFLDQEKQYYNDILGSAEGILQSNEALNALFENRLGTIDTVANSYEDTLGSSEGLMQSEEALNDIFESRLGTIDDTANKYVDILGSTEGLKTATEAVNSLWESGFSRLDKTASTYVDVLGSAEGLSQAERAGLQVYESRLGTIDDTANKYVDILGSASGLAKSEKALNAIYKARLGTIDDTANNYTDVLGSVEGLADSEQGLNDYYESRLGTIDDTANLYEDILGSSEGLASAQAAVNQLWEEGLTRIDKTASTYVDVLGSEQGLSASVKANLAVYEARLGTIDDTANKYVDVLGSETGLKSAVDVLNDQYETRLELLQKMADEYEDILGSEEGLLAAEAARRGLTYVGDSGYGGGRGGDPRGFTYMDEFRKQLKELEDERNKKKKENIKSTQDEIDKLMEAIRVEETRLNLGEEEARQLEILQDLRRFNADADIDLTEKEMKAAAAKIAQMEQANQKLEEQKQKYKDLGDFIGNSFEDSFMSIVDGTKSVEDAFRDMARQIIAELYRVLVVQKAVAGIKTALGGGPLGFLFGSADGNAFSNGNVIPYANGGVVGSPTYFPMSGGRTGLMGEAGPEAIMPLKRGKDGKLGVQVEGSTGDNITVNQTINVTTGVQQTVRNEIQSLMPQISEAAKIAVVDTKRRGGSYGRAFS